MVFKKFRIQLLLRVLAISATSFLFFIALESVYYSLPALAIILLVVQVYYLIRYVEKTNRDIANFLESIRFADFEHHTRAKGMGGSFDELGQAFDHVMYDFQKIRTEKEEHYHYLQSIVQNIQVSIIAYLPDGHIELINREAKKLFQVSALKNIKALEPLSSELVHTFFTIKPGKNYLVKVTDDDDILQLAISATELKIRNKKIIIATISNIQNVLEEQETESWQKLIRVLTHEIMNSIAPIASLSATLELMLKKPDNELNSTEPFTLSNNSIEEIRQALLTINKRSNGLLHFVNTYRNLTRIPKPNFKITKVESVLSNIRLLIDDEIKKQKIDCKVAIQPETLEIFADEQLIEQVIINLIRNSIHALEGCESPTILIKGYYNKRFRPVIQVIDNGKGIEKEVLDKIFIPFFTTKPSGSGIGLSLSRQIMRLHNGSISAHSEPCRETLFTLVF